MFRAETEQATRLMTTEAGDGTSRRGRRSATGAISSWPSCVKMLRKPQERSLGGYGLLLTCLPPSARGYCWVCPARDAEGNGGRQPKKPLLLSITGPRPKVAVLATWAARPCENHGTMRDLTSSYPLSPRKPALRATGVFGPTPTSGRDASLMDAHRLREKKNPQRHRGCVTVAVQP
jgi:hypothetical protein